MCVFFFNLDRSEIKIEIEKKKKKRKPTLWSLSSLSEPGVLLFQIIFYRFLDACIFWKVTTSPLTNRLFRSKRNQSLISNLDWFHVL